MYKHLIKFFNQYSIFHKYISPKVNVKASINVKNISLNPTYVLSIGKSGMYP